MRLDLLFIFLFLVLPNKYSCETEPESDRRHAYFSPDGQRENIDHAIDLILDYFRDQSKRSVDFIYHVYCAAFICKYNNPNYREIPITTTPSSAGKKTINKIKGFTSEIDWNPFSSFR